MKASLVSVLLVALAAFVVQGDEHVYVLSDGVEGQAGLENPDDLGESAGTTDDDRLIDQTSSIDKEVSALGAEVAALEKDHSATQPKGDEDAAPDNPDPVVPAREGKMKSEQKELRSAATTKAKVPPPPPTAKGAASAAEKKKAQEVKEKEKNKAEAEEKKEKVKAKKAQGKAQKSAEKKAEKKGASKQGGSGGATAGKAGSSSVPLVAAKPQAEQDAPEPTRAKDSAAVRAAKKRPMPNPAAVKVLPDGEYPMMDGKALELQQHMKGQRLRDIALAKQGGLASNVLPENDASMEEEPEVDSKPGIIQTADGPVKDYSPPTPTHMGYCKAYAARMDAKKKWTSKSCKPDWVPQKGYQEIMRNLDGVICACGGMKVANTPADSTHPDMQQSIIVRAQPTKNRIRSYAYRISTNVQPKRPQPTRGLAWDVELTDQAATVSDTEVNPKEMRSVFVGFTRIFEYADNTGKGLTDTETKHLDATTGRLWPGQPCDAGKLTSKAVPGKNCVLQDFFLDNFKLATLKVQNTRTTVKFETDLQGTSPWCSKEKCAKPPAKKPTITFYIGSDSASFAHNKMNITIENFPYKQSNSFLALRASLFAESVKPEIAKTDEVSKSMPGDSTDCTKIPTPKGCPMVNMDDSQVNLNWAKTISDTSTGIKYKVITTHPSRAKSGTAGTDGRRLVLKNTYFSFKHGMSKKLLWDPELNTKPSKLPRDLKSAAACTAVTHVSMLVLTVLTLAAVR